MRQGEAVLAVKRAGVLMALLLVACGDDAPSDDPADYDVDSSVEYDVEVSELRWVVPSQGLPREALTQMMPSNNNLDIIYHEDRLFFAWRTSETHFASPNTKMHIVSSVDGGFEWQYEHTIAIGTDVREPRFLSIDGKLFFYYFEAGDSEVAFTPVNMWYIAREDFGQWSAPIKTGEPSEVPWDVKVRGDVAYMTSYSGETYAFDGSDDVAVFLKKSTDGETWTPATEDNPVSYRGGLSEVAFELDEDGSGWFVGRNQQGDDTGFGALVCHSPADRLGAWDCPDESDPFRYDSPEMFRHGDDIYLVARRDIGGPYDLMEPGAAEDRGGARVRYELAYWGRAKRTALYRIDKAERRVVHVLDLPSAGDTAFPAVRRIDAHTFLLANYTSPLDDPDIAWVEGQGSSKGTQIYFVTLTFRPL